MSTRDDNDRVRGGETLDASEGELVTIDVPAIQHARQVLERVVGEALAAATFDHGADFRPGVALSELVKRAPERMRDAGLVEQEPARDYFADRATPALVEWFDTFPPKRAWLLERDGEGGDQGKRVGFLPLGKVGVLAAAGGAGKTMALVQLALSVATGHPWLGDFTVPEASRGHVLLALGEEDAAEVQRRLYNAFRAMWPGEEARHSSEQRAAMQRAAERITVLPLAGAPVAFVTTDPKTREVSETRAHGQLRALLENAGHEWSLVVLDPLSRFAGAETETDNAAATRFVQAIEGLVSVPGNPTVLVAHHTTKSSRKGEDPTDSTSVRGSSALTDGVRWVATLVPEKSSGLPGDKPARVFLELTKSNYGPPDRRRDVMRAEGGALRAPTPEERKAFALGAVEVEARKREPKGTKPGAGIIT